MPDSITGPTHLSGPCPLDVSPPVAAALGGGSRDSTTATTAGVTELEFFEQLVGELDPRADPDGLITVTAPGSERLRVPLAAPLVASYLVTLYMRAVGKAPTAATRAAFEAFLSGEAWHRMGESARREWVGAGAASHPLAHLLFVLLDAQGGSWEGDATDLLQRLRQLTYEGQPNRDLAHAVPDTAQKLGRRIAALAEALRLEGVRVRQCRTARKRTLSLTVTGPASNAALTARDGS